MTATITPFNPSTTPTGTVPLNLPNGGWFLAINETISAVSFQFGTGRVCTVPPLTLRMMRVSPDQTQMVTYSVPYALQNVSAGGVTNDSVYGEVYAPNEWDGGEFILTIASRLSNIGNSTPVSQSVTQVINDGNAAPATVVEGTPSGATSSQLQWNNDGSGTFGGGHATIDATGLLTTTEFWGKLHGHYGNGSIDGATYTTGTGSGTFSHSLGITPTTVQVTCITANSSQTQGTDTWTSTTFHVTSGAGFSWTAFLVKMV